MIRRQVLLYSQHLWVNLVWKIAADYFVKNMIQDIADELTLWHTQRPNVFAANR